MNIRMSWLTSTPRLSSWVQPNWCRTAIETAKWTILGCTQEGTLVGRGGIEPPFSAYQTIFLTTRRSALKLFYLWTKPVRMLPHLKSSLLRHLWLTLSQGCFLSVPFILLKGFKGRSITEVINLSIGCHSGLHCNWCEV